MAASSHNGVTPKKQQPNGLPWMEPFLAVLRNTANVRSACEAAGISRVDAYRQRKRNAGFAKRWQEAIDEAVDLLEAEAFRRGMAISDTLLIFLLKCHRPTVYRDRVGIEVEHVRQEVEVMAAAAGIPAEEVDRVYQNVVNIATRKRAG
jgi:hypothetical protein